MYEESIYLHIYRLYIIVYEGLRAMDKPIIKTMKGGSVCVMNWHHELLIFLLFFKWQF